MMSSHPPPTTTTASVGAASSQQQQRQGDGGEVASCCCNSLASEPDDPDDRSTGLPSPPRAHTRGHQAPSVTTLSAPIPIVGDSGSRGALASSLGSSLDSASPSSSSLPRPPIFMPLNVVSLTPSPRGSPAREDMDAAASSNSSASSTAASQRGGLRTLVTPLRSASPSLVAIASAANGAAAVAAGGTGVVVSSSICGGSGIKMATAVRSLKVLCSAAICRNVGAFKGAAAQEAVVPPVILKRLLRAVLLRRSLSDETMGFFLADRLLELELDCTGNSVSDAAIGLVPLCCPRLKRLAVSNAPLVGDRSATLLANMAPPSLQQSLTSLSLVRCDISDDAVLSITSAFGAITSLNLSGCTRLTAVSFDAIGRAYGASLESLHARGIPLSSDAVRALAKNLSAIVVLDLSIVKYNPQDPTPDEDSLCSLVEKCGPTLKELALSGLPFNDRVMQQLALAAGASLQILELSWPDPRSKFIWSVKLTNAGITHLANHCTNIKQLGLAYCTRLDDQAIVVIGRQLHYLEKINLTGIAGVTDKGISALATPSMKRLKVRDCIVNSFSLFNIATYCPNLEYLDVRSSTFPSEDSFKAVARSCPQLTTLLGRLSNELVLQLQLLCPKLQVPIKRQQNWEQQSWETVCAECWGETI